MFIKPRIILSSSDITVVFKLRKQQLPIKVVYAITINKTQSQRLKKNWNFFIIPIFVIIPNIYGQLYVAFSKAKTFSDLSVSIIKGPKQKLSDTVIYTKMGCSLFKKIIYLSLGPLRKMYV